MRWVCLAPVALAALPLLGACASDGATGATCPDVDGVFEPHYTRLDGTCGDPCEPGLATDGSVCFEPLELRLTDSGLVLTETIRPEYSFDNSTTQDGCDVEFLQTILARDDEHGATMRGELEMSSADLLTGSVTRQEWGLGHAVLCEGTYEATLTRIPGAVP